ncbi:hypothetical protein MKY82_31375 [Paenibacillus sp. FSL W7-1279]|uniref:hypothetical protein n=1 Tax=Paenibacillus sp. FSL W7-1279 TaxID=2921697 RepID=UPI0030DCEB64
MSNKHEMISPAEELLRLYQVVMEIPSYDHYSEHEERMTKLYDHLCEITLTEYDRSLLSEVQVLHEKLTEVILNEKRILNEEINLFEKRKRISDHYGRQSNNYNVDAFFLDYKK